MPSPLQGIFSIANLALGASRLEEWDRVATVSIEMNRCRTCVAFFFFQVDKLDRLVSAGVLTPNDISERVHVIYQTFGDKIKQNQAYEGIFAMEKLAFGNAAAGPFLSTEPRR